MAISPAELAAATGMPAERAVVWAPHVAAVVEAYELRTPRRLAMWLAQCAHESDGFGRLVENLKYSAAALRRVWPARFPTDAIAQRYAGHAEMIADRVYGGRMGNGPEASGDGWRYRGRGPLQLTGRANTAAVTKALGVDFVATPVLLSEPEHGAASAGWFWDTRKLNALADTGDVAAVTRRINGGTHGLDQRRARYARALKALESPHEVAA